MSYEEQKKRITIKIIPHVKGDLISFKLSKFLFKLVISLIIIVLFISSLGFLYYYQKCTEASVTISKLRQVEKRNQVLKNRLQDLAQEANLLEVKFEEIQQTNKRVKKIISHDVNKRKIHNQQELTIYQTSDQVKSETGYDFDLNLSNNSRTKLIDGAQDRLSELKELFSQKQAELNKLK